MAPAERTDNPPAGGRGTHTATATPVSCFDVQEAYAPGRSGLTRGMNSGSMRMVLLDRRISVTWAFSLTGRPQAGSVNVQPGGECHLSSWRALIFDQVPSSGQTGLRLASPVPTGWCCGLGNPHRSDPMDLLM